MLRFIKKYSIEIIFTFIICFVFSIFGFGFYIIYKNIIKTETKLMETVKNNNIKYKYTDVDRSIRYTSGLSTIEHDGCEYVVSTISSNVYILHKQNCKYCNKGK